MEPALKDVVENLDVAFTRHADAQDCIEHSSADVSFLEEQLATLRAKLDAKHRERDRLERVMDETEAKVELGYAVAPGIAIRYIHTYAFMQRQLSIISYSGCRIQ